MSFMGFKDKIIGNLIKQEKNRQSQNIELIASENYVSQDVLNAAGSILTNKYAEGYSGKRYYDGCGFIDEIENVAIERLKKLFDVEYVNVQPHSGTSANLAAYMALLQPGDKILGMDLSAGGHLSHGYKITASGKLYESYSYGVNSSGVIDYQEVREIALKVKPKLIVCGASAYSRIIDFKKFKSIADEVGAYLMADIAHIAGLVATGLHPSPVPYADIITSTTHKTLRGPRSGIIMTNNEEIYKKVNSAVFPGIQGGPLEHIIAAKAICFGEALKPSFKDYQEKVVHNAKTMVDELKANGVKIVSGITENHLFIINTQHSFGLSGKEAAERLDLINITVNKNSIPNDELPPSVTSGIRIGTPAMTSRGLDEARAKKLAKLIYDYLSLKQITDNTLEEFKKEVKVLSHSLKIKKHY